MVENLASLSPSLQVLMCDMVTFAFNSQIFEKQVPEYLKSKDNLSKLLQKTKTEARPC